MTRQFSKPDPAFVERQKRRLTKMRQQILEVRSGLEREAMGVKSELSGQAREFEEDGQKLTTRELEENLEVVEEGRLAAIERALQKIDDGTYGSSDTSGSPIPVERLEAYPEALYTLEEQQAREAASDAAR